MAKLLEFGLIWTANGLHKIALQDKRPIAQSAAEELMKASEIGEFTKNAVRLGFLPANNGDGATDALVWLDLNEDGHNYSVKSRVLDNSKLSGESVIHSSLPIEGQSQLCAIRVVFNGETRELVVTYHPYPRSYRIIPNLGYASNSSGDRCKLELVDGEIRETASNVDADGWYTIKNYRCGATLQLLGKSIGDSRAKIHVGLRIVEDGRDLVRWESPSEDPCTIESVWLADLRFCAYSKGRTVLKFYKVRRNSVELLHQTVFESPIYDSGRLITVCQDGSIWRRDSDNIYKQIDQIEFERPHKAPQ